MDIFYFACGSLGFPFIFLLFWILLKYGVSRVEVRFKTELWNPLTMAHEMATTLFFGSLGLYATYLTNQIYFSDSTELTDTSINLSESNFKDMITYLSFASGVYVGDIGACLAVQPFLGSWQSLGFNILIAIIVPLSTYFHVLPLLLIAVICCDSCQLFSKPQRILVRLGFAPTNISMLFFQFWDGGFPHLLSVPLEHLLLLPIH